MNPITIANYEPHHQRYFEKFNRFWIEKYFAMEPLDEFVLTNPEEAILKPGGAVLIGFYNGLAAGVAGLRKLDDTTFEFTKMAVEQSFQRKGIAEALCYACLEKAKQLGAKKVVLFSNSVLTPAIHLYEKIGFKHVPVGKSEYSRSDVKMEIVIDQSMNYNSHFKHEFPYSELTTHNSQVNL